MSINKVTGKITLYLLIIYVLFNCVKTSTDFHGIGLDKILVPGEQPVLFMEQDVSWDHRKYENWRLVSVHLKPKASSSSTTLTFGGSSYPSWFRSIQKCYKWLNYFETSAILQLIEQNTTIKYIPIEIMNELYSACDLSERLKGSSPLMVTSSIDNQQSPTMTDGQLIETETQKIDKLLKSKGSSRVLIKFNYWKDDVNNEAKPLEGIIIHLENNKGSQLTINQSIQGEQLKVDYCRLLDKVNLEKYSTINPKTVTINLDSDAIEIVSNLCKDALNLENVEFDLLSKLIAGQQLKEINFLEVDNESWKSKGTRNFLIHVLTRSKARSFKWLINKPNSLPQWSLIVDHCDIYSHPDLVDLLMTNETGNKPTINVNNHLINRSSIKYLLNACDYVNVYQN